MQTIIHGATIGEPVPCLNKNFGDVWTATWADDGQLYCVSDDTSGFDDACASNLAVHRLHGDLPPSVRGETINPMSEYGRGYQSEAEDGGSWKAAGLTCIDGVLYLSVSRHAYVINEPYRPFPIQETWDASIVMSRDHGATWSRMPQLGQAMFPGRIFSTPFFVEYGQNGTGGSDGADTYVYAVSNDGAWNNGNFMTLGRVPRDRIERLDPGDWEFVHDFDPAGDPIWRHGHLSARYIFRAPGRTSMTGIHYIQLLKTYIMPQWHYHHLDEDRPRKQHSGGKFSGSCLEFYQAPAPWGPWTRFHSQTFEREAWYNPNIPSKFIADDGQHFWMFVSGGFGDWPSDNPYYALWMYPVSLDLVGTREG